MLLAIGTSFRVVACRGDGYHLSLSSTLYTVLIVDFARYG